MNSKLRASFAFASLALTAAALGDLSVPALDSNPGATYTIYLDFAGFDYSGVTGASGTPGAWGFGNSTPGVVHAYDTDGDASNFSAGETDAIRQTWAVLAQTYVGFNVNVTTVDPAAGAADYAARQTAYDAAPHLMHTSIGGDYDWFGGAGGVSYVGTSQSANTFSGGHTNWVFGNGTANYPLYMGTAGAHENGHGLSLSHQHDEATGGEYTEGDYNNSSGPDNNYRAAGTYGATMGAAYYTQRGTWRIGDPNKGNANDVAVLESNQDMGPLQDDGIGHTGATATALAINADGTVNVASTRSKGFVVPLASTGYSADQYMKDVFSFSTAGGLVTLTANDGTDWLQAGVADPGATMRCVMNVYTSTGALVGSAVESADTLSHSFAGILAAGNYYAEIGSYGAYVSSHEPNARYFNMGGYFLTGSGFTQAVPEPASVAALGLGALVLLRRRKSA